MADHRNPFGLALARLREALRDGAIGPGQPLLAAELAGAFKISATPVREALSRLAGEGLVEDRRGRGFYALRPGAAEIEEYYGLHQALIALALQLSPQKAALARDVSFGGPGSYRERTEGLWSAVMHRADAGVILRAHQRLADQLALVRLFEPAVLPQVSGELEALEQAETPAALGRLSEDYHRRRRDLARALEGCLREAVYPLKYSVNII